MEDDLRSRRPATRTTCATRPPSPMSLKYYAEHACQCAINSVAFSQVQQRTDGLEWRVAQSNLHFLGMCY